MADKDKAPKALKLPANLLKADPQNARTIEAPALRGLGVSMETFGDLSGIVWNERSGHLVAGHQRMNRLKAAGVDDWVRDGNAGTITHPKTGEVFAIRVVDWDPTTERMANLTANNPEIQGNFTEEAAAQLRSLEDEMMFEALALDGLQEDLDREIKKAEDEAKAGNTDPDDVPDAPAKPITKRGDLWVMGDHRLLCGDCTRQDHLVRLLEGESPAVVLTDPPYGMGKDGIANDGADEWANVLREAVATIPRSAWIYAFCSARLELWREAMAILAPERVIIWHKPFALGFPHQGIAWHFEPCLVRPGTGKPAGNISDVLSIGAILRKDDPESQPHPTQKPEELFRVLLAAAPPGAVYDPFLGSGGTTVIAGERLGRRVFAMELEPKYVDITVARWEAFTGKQAVRHRPPDPAAKPTKGVKAPSQPTP